MRNTIMNKKQLNKHDENVFALKYSYHSAITFKIANAVANSRNSAYQTPHSNLHKRPHCLLHPKTLMSVLTNDVCAPELN